MLVLGQSEDISSMDKIEILIFTDPMMGLSYEAEPIIDKLEEEYKGKISFTPIMSLLVDDVYRFCNPNDLLISKEYALKRYLPKLASIYKEEESISGLPINMDSFHLFDKDHTSSLPLNLAYLAVKLMAPNKTKDFLRALRRKTVVETKQTTDINVILEVVNDLNINKESFLKAYYSSEVKQMLHDDLSLRNKYQIYSLPSYLIRYKKQEILLLGFCYYERLSDAIKHIINKNVSYSGGHHGPFGH